MSAPHKSEGTVSLPEGDHVAARKKNPFQEPLVTELIENPNLYQKLFSESILVDETIEIFRASNAVLLGPQGAGKSMILNLIRYKFLAQWLANEGKPPASLEGLGRFLGISINLVRANFHAFGRRSFSKASGRENEPNLDALCAADFLNHFLFRELIFALRFLGEPGGRHLAAWLGIQSQSISSFLKEASELPCWLGYYSNAGDMSALLARSDERLNGWRNFLNGNVDSVPDEVFRTKSDVGVPLHAVGNLLQKLPTTGEALPLFIIIDQYEVLPELNKTYGTDLQRVVNTLIKARDPVVFYKIGARTYDWGRELRIFGAESRIEVQRDYIMVDLSKVLMRKEDSRGWLFPKFAAAVAQRRALAVTDSRLREEAIADMFGKWSPESEAELYFRKKTRIRMILRVVPKAYHAAILEACGDSPLDLRLAGAWILQQLNRKSGEAEIVARLKERPWDHQWWRKERIGVALVQIASSANQRRRYFGWKPITYLAGANISAFLLICSEIWDAATKQGCLPFRGSPLDPRIQTQGILNAASKWLERDRNEAAGGRMRYQVLSRLGPAIHSKLKDDYAISNPGHSGFSLRESDLSSASGAKVTEFLQNAVSWAIFEERVHTSRNVADKAARRKWYLHPLLCAAFGIPFIRVKEPYYATVEEVAAWLFSSESIRFGRKVFSGDLAYHTKHAAIDLHQLEIKFSEE
jgi:hypothetical protein